MSERQDGPLRGPDRIAVSEWVADLTYGEVHAAIWGFALAAVATLTQSDVLGALFVGLLLYAFGVRATAGRDSRVDLGDVPDQVARQIRRQPHYYIVGGVVGVAIGFLGLALGVDATALTPFIPF